MSGRKGIHVLDVVLADPKAEQVRQHVNGKLRELGDREQVVPLGEVVLPDNTTIRVGHPLGRYPKLVLWSPPRGASTAGILTEVRDGIDRSKFVAFKATGFGATIRVDIGVV